MEEIARNIEKLIETLNENSIPNWINIPCFQERHVPPLRKN